MLIKAKCVIGARAKNGTSPLYPGCVYDVDDILGKRLCDEEVAEFAEKSAHPARAEAKPSENPSTEETAQNSPENAGNGQIAGHLDRDQLQEMSYTDLKALAKDMGIETGKIKSKAGMIEAICAVEVYADADDPEEAPPVFDAQDVID